MSYTVTEFSVFLLPVDADANAVLFMTTLKVMTCCRVIPGSLVVATEEQNLRGDREGEGGVRLRRNCTAVLHHTAVRQRLVTVSDKYRAPHCSSISACCLEGGKGRVTWELPLSSFILAKLALDSQDIKDYCDSMVADRVR